MKLGEILVQLGILTPGQVGSILHEQERSGARFGTQAILKKLATSDQISEALSRQQATPAALDRHFDRAMPSVLGMIKPNLALRFRAIPLVLATGPAKRVVVAMTDPHDMPTVDDVAFALGAQIDPMIAAEYALAQNLKRYYRLDLDLANTNTPAHTRIQVPLEKPLSPVLEPAAAAAPLIAQPALPSPPPVALEDALHRLSVTGHRDQVVDILLDYMLPHFGCGLVLRAKQDQLGVWRGYCDGMDSHAVEAIHFPLDTSPVFHTPYTLHHPFIGPPPREAAPFHTELAQRLGGTIPSEVIVVPILVGTRVASMVYGHGRSGGPLSPRAVHELQAMAAGVGNALLRLIQDARAAS
jgi:hypothetical protein